MRGKIKTLYFGSKSLYISHETVYDKFKKMAKKMNVNLAMAVTSAMDDWTQKQKELAKLRETREKQGAEDKTIVDHFSR